MAIRMQLETRSHHDATRRFSLSASSPLHPLLFPSFFHQRRRRRRISFCAIWRCMFVCICFTFFPSTFSLHKNCIVKSENWFLSRLRTDLKDLLLLGCVALTSPGAAVVDENLLRSFFFARISCILRAMIYECTNNAEERKNVCT